MPPSIDIQKKLKFATNLSFLFVHQTPACCMWFGNIIALLARDSIKFPSKNCVPPLFVFKYKIAVVWWLVLSVKSVW